jgi:hypothetical protein
MSHRGILAPVGRPQYQADPVQLALPRLDGMNGIDRISPILLGLNQRTREIVRTKESARALDTRCTAEYIGN